MATLALEPDQPTLLDLLEEPPRRPAPPAPAPVADPPLVADPGERTLEDLVLGAWEALADDRAASCPLCAGELAPRLGAGARPVGSRCAGCATELA